MNDIIILIIITLAIIVYYNGVTAQKIENITNVQKPLTPYEILQYYPADGLGKYAKDDRIIKHNKGSYTIDPRMYIS